MEYCTFVTMRHVQILRLSLFVTLVVSLMYILSFHSDKTSSRINAARFLSMSTTKHSDKVNDEFGHEESGDRLIEAFINELRKDFFPQRFWSMSLTELCHMFDAVRRTDSFCQNKLPLGIASSSDNQANWMRFQSNIRQGSVYDPKDPAVEDLLRDMASLLIVQMAEIYKGKQFKLSVKFVNEGEAVLKPARNFGRNDRHYAEIAAFHLDRLLGFYRVPPTVGRRVHVETEMAAMLPAALRKTLFKSEDGSMCFHGRCTTCKTSNPICGTPDYVNVSLMQMLPNNDDLQFQTAPTPWKKWKRGKIVPGWVSESYLCARTRTEFESGQPLLSEIIDVVYFDMLIDNSDRHQHAYYGYFQNQSNVILFDSGKGFINASEDAFLENFLFERGGCCLVKKSTLLKLLKTASGPDSLARLLARSLAHDPLAPVLTDDHLEAVDRRVRRILTYLRGCIRKDGVDAVVLDDMKDVNSFSPGKIPKINDTS